MLYSPMCRFHEGLATLMEHYGRLEALEFGILMLW